MKTHSEIEKLIKANEALRAAIAAELARSAAERAARQTQQAKSK